MTHWVLCALHRDRPQQAQEKDRGALPQNIRELGNEGFGKVRGVLDEGYGGHNALGEDEGPDTDIHLETLSTSEETRRGRNLP